MSPILQVRCCRKNPMLFTTAVKELSRGKGFHGRRETFHRWPETGKHLTSVRSNSHQKSVRNSRTTLNKEHCFHMNHLWVTRTVKSLKLQDQGLLNQASTIWGNCSVRGNHALGIFHTLGIPLGSHHVLTCLWLFLTNFSPIFRNHFFHLLWLLASCTY